MNHYMSIPDELQGFDHWICWEFVEIKDGKQSKVPINPWTGRRAKTTDPSTWSDFDTAVEKSKGFDGIGFVFTDTPFVGIDLDHVGDALAQYHSGKEDNIVGEFITTLESYTEVSQSGQGLHIIVKGTLPRGGNRKGRVEMYDRNSPRYFVMTGDNIGLNPVIREAPDELQKLYSKYISDNKSQTQNIVGQRADLMKADLAVSTATSRNMTFSDDAVIEKALHSKNGEMFRVLYEGKWEDAGYSSESEATIALLNILAFWTGKDAERMDKIFRMSGLMREKFNEPRGASTWGSQQVEKAIQDCKQVYSQNRSKSLNGNIALQQEDVHELFGAFEFQEGLMVAITPPKKTDGDANRKVFFNGYINIKRSLVDLDAAFTQEILEIVTYTSEKRRLIRIPKAILPNDQKLIEALSAQCRILVPADYKAEMRRYLEAQYLGKLAEGSLQTVYVTREIGFLNYRKNDLFINGFVYPHTESPIDFQLLYSADGPLNAVFVQNGNMEVWIRDVFHKLNHNMNAFILVLGMFASIIIEPLETVENFTMDLSGPTATGKTTLLTVASSIYGKDSLIADWNTTSNAIISKAVELRNFPMLIDDTKKCSDKSMIAELLYQVSGGKEKARSTQEGNFKGVRTFRNIMITTGETPIIDYLYQGTSNGRGAYSRILLLTGGFLENSEENGRVLSQILESCKQNYGVVGAAWVKFIVDKVSNKDTVKQLRASLQKYKELNGTFMNSDISRRLGGHVALLQVTYDLLVEFNASFCTSTATEHFENLLQHLKATSEEYDNYDAAYHHFLETCDVEAWRFIRMGYPDGTEITTKREDSCWGEETPEAYQIKSMDIMYGLLSPFGDPRDILRAWKERNYLQTDSEKFKKNIRIAGKVEGRYCVTKA